MAHVIGNKVKAAYCRAEFLEEREKMMQFWSDYLDYLRTGTGKEPSKDDYNGTEQKRGLKATKKRKHRNFSQKVEECDSLKGKNEASI